MMRTQVAAFLIHILRYYDAECDVDGSGSVDAKELHIGILIFYDKLNSKLPVHVKPPKHKDVQVYMKSHDISSDGHLNREEFASCVKSMIGLGEKGAFGSLQFQVIRRMALKMLIFPLVAAVIKKGADAGGIPMVDKIPDSVLVLGLEAASKSIKVAIPGIGE